MKLSKIRKTFWISLQNFFFDKGLLNSQNMYMWGRSVLKFDNRRYRWTVYIYDSAEPHNVIQVMTQFSGSYAFLANHFFGTRAQNLKLHTAILIYLHVLLLYRATDSQKTLHKC